MLATCGCAVGATIIVGGIVFAVGFLVVGNSLDSNWYDPMYGSDGPHSGWQAMWAGDVNGDGTPDIILMTSFEPWKRGYGRTRILSGSTGEVLRTLDELRTDVPLTDVIGQLGDVDNDGRDDLWWSPDSGSIVVGRGVEGRDLARIRIGLGECVSPMGDIDADGWIDLLISGYPDRGSRWNTIGVVSTRTQRELWSLSRPDPRDMVANPFGWVSCCPGDINSDGVPDAATIDEDETMLIASGRDGTVINRFPIRTDWISGVIASVGDVDDDGVPDILHCADLGQSVRVLSGRTGDALVVLQADGAYADPFSPGDLDGDGNPEIAFHDHEGLRVVRARDGAELFSRKDVRSAPGAEDFNSDGRSDLLVVENTWLPVGVEPPEDMWSQGRVEIVSGRDQSVLLVVDGKTIADLNRPR